MRIEVTAEDIATGKCRDPENCAVAVAMRRQGFVVRSIGAVFHAKGPIAWLKDNDGCYTKIELPVEVGAFARLFDEGKTMLPFAFELATEATTGGKP